MYMFVFVLFNIYSCRTKNITERSKEYSNQQFLFETIEAVYSKQYSDNSNLNIPDTIFLNPKAYLHGSYVYGMMNYSFYYGYIDTVSFPNLKKSKELLPYYENIQQVPLDTVMLSINSLEINEKPVIIDYSEKHSHLDVNSKQVSITPLVKYNNSYTIGLIGRDVTYVASLFMKENKFNCSNISYYDDGSNLNPCSVPDTLRNVNFKSLY